MPKLPLPRQISATEIMELFKSHGYHISAEKSVSIDVCEMIQVLLTIAQWVQWWGTQLHSNNKTIGYKLDAEKIDGFSVHAAGAGQQIGIVRIKTIDDVLNMLSNWMGNLRHYGKDGGMRRERLDDSEGARLQNETLDTYAKSLLDLMALALPADPV